MYLVRKLTLSGTVPRISISSSNIVRNIAIISSREGVDSSEQTIPNEVVQNLRPRKVDDLGRSYGTGRRKTSVARVWIYDGSGQVTVNNRNVIDYFQPIQRQHALSSFLLSNTAGMFDVWCTVKGGGISGQAGAVRLGISRALEAYTPSLRPVLRKEGLLTRDSRRVERKKPGLKKARKQYQWVKR
mmetsp:Transcript_34838/g.35503  ORF Transcript_34838/g.35503 Transcript_34838/m.35503 type:complete len:186 (+) Transcript_34838:101-658(+)